MEQTGEYRKSKLSVFRTRPELTALIVLIGFYLFISNFFAWNQAWVDLALNTSGGSDPYYNYRVIEYILTYHHQLLFDPVLNYPLGANNPRPPFFHWFTVFIAVIISPALGGNVNLAAYFFFNELDALFGALLIIPVYLITYEVFGKKAGIVGAVLYTLMPSNLTAGILTDGRMHTPELLFAFFAVYFFMKAISKSPKGRMIESLTDVRSYLPSIARFYRKNRVATIYGILSGASLGGLILSWQGFPYIEVIILLYVLIQLVVNVVRGKPTGHLTYFTIIFILTGFAIGFYSYFAVGTGYLHLWWTSPLYIGVVIILLSLIFNIFGRKQWIITIPSIILISLAGILVLSKVSPSILHEVITGQGYFVKSRVYDTIQEAQSPPLGQYISGFGAAQFILGMAGVGYAVYLYFKNKSEKMLSLLVFSVVSIYMSFAAARFNVTAAPAYAALGGGMLVYFTDSLKMSEVSNRRVSTQVSLRKSVKGNINWLHAVVAVVIVLLMIIPSGFAVVSAAVPANSATSVDHQITSSLPAALRGGGNSSQGLQFLNGYGFSITNNSQILSKSFQWLSTQDSNLSITQKPGYVSWWDYGFQEISQGKHPAVADDFQQGYQIAGQILLAQNQSQIVSLFASRIIQADAAHNNGHFTPNVTKTLNAYFGKSETNLLARIYANPGTYTPWILHNQTVYGNFSNVITSSNAYYALVKGQLSSKYSMSTIVSAYSALEQNTGSSIKYIQVDSSLLPLSGINPGIFYAPAYLTDTPSYTSSSGEIVPTNYYQVYAETANGTFALNQVPKGVQPLNYTLSYTPQFYNTSIYRFSLGYPASVAGAANGLPGVTFGQNQLQAMPAWNMSHFEISYEAIPWSPYKDYQTHPHSFKYIPLSQAYTYRQEGKGTVDLFPAPAQLAQQGTPIVSYYPGAQISGKITLPNGHPAAGLRVTIFDQYGIPHQTVVTGKNGQYNLTGLPGNDTISITSGSYNKLFLLGSNTIKDYSIHISKNQANRVATGYNATTGLPSYDVVKNVQLGTNSVSGFVRNQYQNTTSKKSTNLFTQPLIDSGTITLHNSTYNVSVSTAIKGGQYNFTDLSPISYQATIQTGDNIYRNVSYVNVSNGVSQANDIFVDFNALFVHVKGYSGGGLPGYTVKASGNGGYQTLNVTNTSGGAILWVPPGKYSLYANGNNSVSPIKAVSFNSWGNNESLNLTPAISSSVSGKVINGGSGLNLRFYRNGLSGDAYNVTTGIGGSYSINLPYGTYTAYVADGQKAAAQTFTLNGSRTIDLTPTNAVNLTIGSKLKAGDNYPGAYQVLSNNLELQLNFTGQKQATIELPTGRSYTVSGLVSYEGSTYYNFSRMYLVAERSVNLSLTTGHQQSVFAYDKSLGVGYNAASAISRGLIVLNQSNIPVMYTTVGSGGFAQLTYLRDASSQYSATYQSPYYQKQTMAISANGTSTNMGLMPKLASLKISLETPSNAPKVSGTLHLSGVSQYNLSINNNVVNGGISTDVIPGLYYGNIKSSSLNSELNNPVFVVTSNGASYTKEVSQYASVQVTGAQNLYMFNSTGVRVSNTSMVKLGTYTIYATNNSKAYVSTMGISSNTTVTPTYATGYAINLTNSLSINGGYYILKRNGNILNLTKGQWLLPGGTYSASYYNKMHNSTGSYYVSGTSTATVTSATPVNVSATSVKSPTGIYGTARYNGVASSYTLMEAFNSTGALVNTTHTNDSGYYNMTLPQGTYTIYGVNNASSQAYFGQMSIAPFSGYSKDNLTMRQGYTSHISVNIKSSIITTNVTVSLNGNSIIVNTTESPILLPQGNYTFSASRVVNENIYNGSTISVTYGTNYTKYIYQKSYVQVTLQKSKVYTFVTNQTSALQTISGNGTFSATTTILNAGNSAVNITLSSGSYNWAMTFNRSTLDIQPGQTVNVSETVTGQHNPPAGVNNIPIIISYNGGSAKGYIDAKVVKKYGFTATASSNLAVPNGSKVWIPVSLANTGNSAITVNFSVPNASAKLLGEYNWLNASFYYGGNKVNKVNLAYNTTDTIYVVMTPVANTTAQTVSFNINFNSTAANQTLKVSSAVPGISSLSPYPGGTDIIGNYTGAPIHSLEYGLIAIAVIVLAGIIASGARSRRGRGKR